MQVKNDYPDYRNWYQEVQVPGIYDGTRNIIIAHIADRIVGFVSLKKNNRRKENLHILCGKKISESIK